MDSLQFERLLDLAVLRASEPYYATARHLPVNSGNLQLGLITPLGEEMADAMRTSGEAK